MYKAEIYAHQHLADQDKNYKKMTVMCMLNELRLICLYQYYLKI